MPKDRRDNSSSFDRATVSPYGISDRKNCNRISPSVGNDQEWEEARCPICMEHPHNAVLLLCSSKDKGCRPFMCDTSYRHSNCFDQFCKSSSSSSAQEQDSELTCPFCRGRLTGSVVVESARNFMNSKTRNCSLETCGFSGDYNELRKHARVEHPLDRPCEASLTRKSNWAALEVQMDFDDALAHQSDNIEYDLDGGLPGFLDELVAYDDMFEMDMLEEIDMHLQTSQILSSMNWSEGNFFDFLIDMVEISGHDYCPFLDLNPSPPMDNGYVSPVFFSDVLTNSMSNGREGSASPSSGVRSAIGDEDGRTGHRRENDETYLGSRSPRDRENSLDVSRSRTSYHRENGTNGLRSRSDYHRENRRIDPRSSYTSSRSRYHREMTSSRTRLSYHRENGGTSSRSRSSYHIENSPRTRTSNHMERERSRQ